MGGLRVLGVIPARGGSKGIPRKNLKLLNGKTLIAYIIEVALKAKTLSRLIVSTDDEEIADTARKLGAEVPFLRDPELARDEVSLIPVAKHAMESMDKLGWQAGIIVSLQSTAPFTEPEDIDNAVNKLIETGCDSVVSVFGAERPHPYRALRLEGERLLPLHPEGFRFLQRQDLPTFYALSGGIYVRRRKLLGEWNGKDFALGEDIRAVIIPQERAVDINTPLDFLVAEALIENRGL
ncbi:cytidylyltransferase domain-containing protein [Chloroflexota bacterium]